MPSRKRPVMRGHLQRQSVLPTRHYRRPAQDPHPSPRRVRTWTDFSRGWSEFVITATTGCSVVVTVQAAADGEQLQLRAAGHQALASVQDLAGVRRGGGDDRDPDLGAAVPVEGPDLG